MSQFDPEWEFRKMCIDVEEYEQSLSVFMKLPMVPIKRGMEIGIGWGVSADLFLNANPEATLLSVDIDPTRPAIKVLKEKYGDRFTFKTPDQDCNCVDVEWLYIDGDHTYEGCKADLVKFETMLMDGGILVVDDVYGRKYPQPGVLKAVNEILDMARYHRPIVINSESGPVGFVKRLRSWS